MTTIRLILIDDDYEEAKEFTLTEAQRTFITAALVAVRPTGDGSEIHSLLNDLRDFFPIDGKVETVAPFLAQIAHDEVEDAENKEFFGNEENEEVEVEDDEWLESWDEDHEEEEEETEEEEEPDWTKSTLIIADWDGEEEEEVRQ